MKRAIFLILSIVAIAGVAAYFYYGNRPSSSEEFSSETTANLASMVKTRTSGEPPNIIIILADDLGWADVGYHESDIRTPNIDLLATEGMRLERFYSLPVCTPTRSALMTGRDPIKLGMANAGIMPWNDGGVSLDEHFLPQSFKAAGYDTAMIGKWHLGQKVDHQRRQTKVETMLFDIYTDPGEQTDLADAYPDELKRLEKLLDARLAEHPVGGVYVQVMPHPGWRAPKNYAEAVLPADKVHREPHEGYGAVASKNLQRRYGDKGKIIYE